MVFVNQFIDTDVHPIDIVEDLASHHAWDFDRITENEIALIVKGQWRTYSVTLVWSGYDEVLSVICSFDLAPPDIKLPDLFDLVNKINDQCWIGSFSYWNDQKLMAYRYGLLLAGNQMASSEQIEDMISIAVVSSERYYPALQLLIWGDTTPSQAIQVAIAKTYGHA